MYMSCVSGGFFGYFPHQVDCLLCPVTIFFLEIQILIISPLADDCDASEEIVMLK